LKLYTTVSISKQKCITKLSASCPLHQRKRKVAYYSTALWLGCTKCCRHFHVMVDLSDLGLLDTEV